MQRLTGRASHLRLVQWGTPAQQKGGAAAAAVVAAAGRARHASSAVDAFPLIDCSPLLAPPEQVKLSDRQTAIAQIRSAFETRGFFYAAGVSSLSESYIASIGSFARQAHALPTDEKARWITPRGTYSGIDVGVPELAYEPGAKSSVRAWDYQRSSALGDKEYPGADTLSSANGEDFERVLDTLYAKQDVLARALFGAIAEMFDLPPSTFTQHFTGDLGTIRLLHYPGLDPGVEADSGISAHTDFEALTLMHQDAPGLQLIPRDTGTWTDAPVRPGEFIVILGDVLERFTNGTLRATPHRVVQTPHARNSIIRFFALHPDTVLEPLPQFVSATSPAKYSRVTMYEHMKVTYEELQKGNGAFDPETQQSKTATRVYA